MRTESELFRQANYQDPMAHLFPSRRERSYLTPEDVDYEMQFTKRRDRLKLTKLTQEGLEHFVRHYGSSYQVLYLYGCTRIRDLSPVGDLPGLEAVRIEWCRGLSQLWDMSKNSKLKLLSVCDAKKLVWEPASLHTAKALEEVRFWGPVSGGTYPMVSLECFRDMKPLRRIDLNWIRLENRSMDVLESLPELEEFHFDPGMLTTEEIARIVARYPRLSGDSLRAYDDEHIEAGEVRVCGFRKPTLYLPKHQKRLEQYTTQFEELVAQYRRELGTD